MHTTKLAGIVLSAVLWSGCSKSEPKNSANQADAAYHAGSVSTAPQDVMDGGVYYLAPGDLQQFESSACDGTSYDGGIPTGTDAGLDTCVYPLPVIPGRNPDPDEVHVVLSETSGAALLIGRYASDCSQGDGWYPGSDNQSIILCPQTCARITAGTVSLVVALISCVRGGPV